MALLRDERPPTATARPPRTALPATGSPAVRAVAGPIAGPLAGPFVIGPLVAGPVVVGVLVGVLVAALLVGGARPGQVTPGLPDAGPVTGWGLPVAELLARLLAVVVVGRLALVALLVPRAARQDDRVGTVLPRTAPWAAAWLLAEAARLLLTASSLYAVPVTALTVPAVTGLLTGLAVGRSALVVAVALTVLVLGCPTALRRSARRHGPGSPVGAARALLVVALAAVVVPVVLTGHSAAAADHVAAVVTLSVHVVAASLWVGGLLALLALGRDRPWAPAAVGRFSMLALVCVALLVGSGLLAAVLVGGAPRAELLATGWGRLLLAKTVLLVVLATAGWWHRRRTVPALLAGRPRAFVRLGAVELLLMAVTVAVSVGLSASPAPDPADGAVEPVPPAAAAAPPAGAGAVAEEPPTDAPLVEDMSGHDHGELSVTVLVDEQRFHVSAPVRPGQRVTVYNSSSREATLTAVDGSFDAVVPSRSFLTFEAPAVPGDYAFSSVRDASFADTLRVREAG